MAAQWEALEARHAALLVERDRLMEEVYARRVEPALAARPLLVLADKLEALEGQYEEWLRERSETDMVETPHVMVRLEQAVLDELRRRAGTSQGGAAGGVALYIRKLVYEHLGWPMPPQRGDLGRSSARRPPKEYILVREFRSKRTVLGTVLAVSKEAALEAAARGEFSRAGAPDPGKGKLAAAPWLKSKREDREALEAIAPALPSTPNTED